MVLTILMILAFLLGAGSVIGIVSGIASIPFLVLKYVTITMVSVIVFATIESFFKNWFNVDVDKAFSIFIAGGTFVLLAIIFTKTLALGLLAGSFLLFLLARRNLFGGGKRG